MLKVGFQRICLALLMACIVCLPSKAQTIRHVKLYFPENIDTKGRQIPLTPQLLNVFAYFEREAKLKFSVVILPWKRAQLEVAKGNGIIYGFSKSNERLENFQFSLPVLSLPVWAISYGAENANIAELKDLRGKIVAASVGVTHGVEFERSRGKIFTVQEDYLSYQERLKKLIAKRCDVILVPFNLHVSREDIDKRFHSVVLAGFNDPELSGRHFNVSINPIFLDTIHFASSKKHFQDVIQRLDLTIERGVKNGSLSKLFKDY